MTKKKIKDWREQYPGRHLHELDKKILHFLWRWKVANIRTLREALSPGQNHNTFNKRIRKLEKNKLIEAQRIFIPNMTLWRLTEIGFQVIRESLGPIRTTGTQSASPYHDAMVLAFQMGNWVWEDDQKPQFVTDQELIQYGLDDLPKGMPDLSGHRADGYSFVLFENEPSALAIEVELHAKSVSRYQNVIRWYGLERKVARVLWLVGDDLVISQMNKARIEEQNKEEDLHVFVRLEDYLKTGWDAACTNDCSKSLGTLREIYGQHMGQEPGEYLGKQGVKSDFTVFTDRRKFLSLSATSLEIPKPFCF